MAGRLRKLRESIKDWSLREQTKKKHPKVSLFLRRKLLKSLSPTRANIRTRFLKLFPDISIANRMGIGDPRILGAGQKRVTLKLGLFIDPETGEEVHLACKLERVRKKYLDAHRNGIKTYDWLPRIPEEIDANFFFYIISDPSHFEADSFNLKRIHNMGIPVAKYYDVVDLLYDYKRPNPKRNYIQVVEDLSQGGRFEVKEFFGFDSRLVKNSSELHKLFEEYFTKMSYKFRISSFAAHDGANSLKDEIERCFFVVIDPETRIGKLVCGDVDQIEYLRKF